MTGFLEAMEPFSNRSTFWGPMQAGRLAIHGESDRSRGDVLTHGCNTPWLRKGSLSVRNPGLASPYLSG